MAMLVTRCRRSLVTGRYKVLVCLVWQLSHTSTVSYARHTRTYRQQSEAETHTTAITRLCTWVAHKPVNSRIYIYVYIYICIYIYRYISIHVSMLLGRVFGSRDFFSGLGVFIDTYANQNGQHNVSL